MTPPDQADRTFREISNLFDVEKKKLATGTAPFFWACKHGGLTPSDIVQYPFTYNYGMIVDCHERHVKGIEEGKERKDGSKLVINNCSSYAVDTTVVPVD